MSILAVSFRPRVANHFSGIDDLVETRLVDVPGLEASEVLATNLGGEDPHPASKLWLLSFPELLSIPACRHGHE
jgi:hypothetical protein